MELDDGGFKQNFLDCRKNKQNCRKNEQNGRKNKHQMEGKLSFVCTGKRLKVRLIVLRCLGSGNISSYNLLSLCPH